MPGGITLPFAFVLVANLQNQTPAPAAAAADSTRSGRHAAAPEIRAARVQGSIVVDGRLDEASWASAVPATRFTQTDPVEGQPASERTDSVNEPASEAACSASSVGAGIWVVVRVFITLS